jgi:hypothetical protein
MDACCQAKEPELIVLRKRKAFSRLFWLSMRPLRRRFGRRIAGKLHRFAGDSLPLKTAI